METQKLTQEQKRIKIAEACGKADRWHVMKRGLYYRPEAHGYTSRPEEAWIITEAEARKLEYKCGLPDEWVRIGRAELPDYFNDLNAARAAVLTLDDKQFHAFTLNLCDISWRLYSRQTHESNADYINRLRVSFAGSAEQQMDALGITLNLWEAGE